MLVTVHKPCYAPHALRIATSGTIFIERIFSVRRERVKSWSYTFLITDNKTLTKKLLASPSKNVTRRKKRKKRTKMAIAKLFALNANAKRKTRMAIAKLFALHANAKGSNTF